LAAAAAASVFLRQREEILAAGDIILFPWESRFSLFPPLNRGAYPESRGDFRGAIWGYDSRISYPPLNRHLDFMLCPTLLARETLE